MKNITITLDAQTAAWTRLHAAERGVSVSRFVGEVLRERMRHSKEYEAAMHAALAVKPIRLEGEYLTRTEVYERARIR